MIISSGKKKILINDFLATSRVTKAFSEWQNTPFKGILFVVIIYSKKNMDIIKVAFENHLEKLLSKASMKIKYNFSNFYLFHRHLFSLF